VITNSKHDQGDGHSDNEIKISQVSNLITCYPELLELKPREYKVDMGKHIVTYI
jgi:hypothetical protein